MKWITALILIFIPLSAMAADESSLIKVEGTTVGLWYFNGPNLASSAGDDEAAADNDFAVGASVTAPAYGDSGFSWVKHSFTDDDGVTLSSGDGLSTAATSTDYVTNLGGITVEFIWKQPSLAADYQYIIEARPSTGNSGWAIRWLGTAVGPAIRGMWFPIYSTAGGTNYYTKIIQEADFSFSTAAGDWQYYCAYYDGSLIGSPTLTGFWVGKLCDASDCSADTDLTDHTTDSATDSDVWDLHGMSDAAVPIDLGHTQFAPATAANASGTYSALHVINVSKGATWCEERFDCLKAGTCSFPGPGRRRSFGW
jgi:hypothetical protein